MRSNLHSWGIYSWFPESGWNLIAQENIKKFQELSPYGKVFECIEEKGTLIWIQYGDQTFCVNSKLFQRVEKPLFKIGEKIRIKKTPEIVGEVKDIFWHFKMHRCYYFLEIEGKKKSKRYMDEEIEPAIS